MKKPAAKKKRKLIDVINKPAHYTKGKFESIDVLEDAIQFYEPVEAFHVGQVVKYLFRAPHKGNKKQDLLKAQYYLDRLVSR